MNRSRALLPAAAGVVLLGVGVYFSGGGLTGDASGAGCAGEEVVDVQTEVGATDSGIDEIVANLSNYDATQLADPAQRAEFDRQLAEVIDAGADAVPSLTNAIQTIACNEPSSDRIVEALHEIIVDKSGTMKGVQGIATVLVSAAMAGLTEYDLPGDDAPSFSDHEAFDALAQEVLAGGQVPRVRAFAEDAANWVTMVEDDDLSRCSLRALDAAVALEDSSVLDELVAALDKVPPQHPAAVPLVEAALDLGHLRTDSVPTFRTIAFDREIHPDARGLACWASAVDGGLAGDGDMPLTELSAEDLSPLFASCTLLTTAPEMGRELAQKVESSNNAMIRVAIARANATDYRGNEVEQLILQMQRGTGSDSPVCNLDNVMCNHGELLATADAIVDLVAEDPDAQADLRARLEVAVADASPVEKTRLTVLARAAEDLWPERIPGLEY